MLFCACMFRRELMFKQATVDDNRPGIRWINSDIIGLTQKNRNKKQGPIDTTQKDLNFGAIYFDWRNFTSMSCARYAHVLLRKPFQAPRNAFNSAFTAFNSVFHSVPWDSNDKGHGGHVSVRSALDSIHQNHLGRERLRLNSNS